MTGPALRTDPFGLVGGDSRLGTTLQRWFRRRCQPTLGQSPNCRGSPTGVRESWPSVVISPVPSVSLHQLLGVVAPAGDQRL
jgi:hypothetical protein